MQIRPDAIEPGKDSYTIGPVLPAERTKAPYHPSVVGRIAFFFGPLAGALVSVVNLRRYGYPVKAKRVLSWTLLAATGWCVVLILAPEILARVLGIAGEFASYKIYSALQEKEFREWQTGHSELQPLNGWRAIGWGFAGLAGLFLMFFVVALGIALAFPSLA